jgi:integrase/recombinase XerC
MYDTGIRVSELVRLSCNALPNESDWPDEVNYYPLLIPGSKPYDGSKFKYRFTIISRPMLARVRRYHSSARYTLVKGWGVFEPEKPMFLTTHGRPLTIDSVQKAIKAAWTRQGGSEREMSPHRLRHGTAFSVLQSEFGKELLDKMLVLKSILGHSNISTTEIYSAIPITALQSLKGKRHVRFEEAQRIYEDTYLPERSHKERRGHTI